ncbi:hypothetical protein Peur_035985 [Populus x canadensis]
MSKSGVFILILLDRVLEEKILEGHTSKNTQLAQQKIELSVHIGITRTSGCWIDQGIRNQTHAYTHKFHIYRCFSKLTMQLEAGFFAKLVILFSAR